MGLKKERNFEDLVAIKNHILFKNLMSPNKFNIRTLAKKIRTGIWFNEIFSFPEKRICIENILAKNLKCN